MSAKTHGLPPVLYVFSDESGSFRHDDYQIVGILLCRDPDARRAELAALRDDYNYRRELKYSDRDTFRLPFALAVLDWFLNTPDLEFRCIVKKGSEVDLNYFSHGWRGLPKETLAYNYTYKEVILNNLPADDHRIIVKIDERTRNQKDNLLAYLRQEIVMVREVTEANSQSDDLLQVVDLLSGCVYGAATGSRPSGDSVHPDSHYLCSARVECEALPCRKGFECGEMLRSYSGLHRHGEQVAQEAPAPHLRAPQISNDGDENGPLIIGAESIAGASLGWD